MDPCAGLHILAHGSIPLPYLPNLCAVLRPAPLASYYFPFLSFPLLSPCIGLSLDTKAIGSDGIRSDSKGHNESSSSSLKLVIYDDENTKYMFETQDLTVCYIIITIIIIIFI